MGIEGSPDGSTAVQEELPHTIRRQDPKMVERRLESRRQMHLQCEHRRRNAIQNGIESLRDLLERGRPTCSIPGAAHHSKKAQLSRVEVLMETVRRIEELETKNSDLKKEYRLAQLEHIQMKRKLLPRAEALNLTDDPAMQMLDTAKCINFCGNDGK